MTEALKAAIWARVNAPGPEGTRARAAVLCAWSITIFESAELREESRQMLTAMLLDHVHRAAGLTMDELAEAVREVCAEAKIALGQITLN